MGVYGEGQQCGSVSARIYGLVAHTVAQLGAGRLVNTSSGRPKGPASHGPAGGPKTAHRRLASNGSIKVPPRIDGFVMAWYRTPPPGLAPAGSVTRAYAGPMGRHRIAPPVARFRPTAGWRPQVLLRFSNTLIKILPRRPGGERGGPQHSSLSRVFSVVAARIPP